MEQPTESETCPDCHARTGDLAAHEAWHSRLVHDIALAVAAELKRHEAAGKH